MGSPRKTDFFDALLETNRPTSAKKELKKMMKFYVLVYLQNYGRARWCKLSDIAMWLLTAKGYDFKKRTAWNWFAANYGLKGEITHVTSYLRKKGYPIIAGLGKKGYRYADENCDDIVEVWDDRRKLWEKSKEISDSQRKIDIKLLEKVIEKIKSKKKKEQLMKIKAIYRRK